MQDYNDSEKNENGDTSSESASVDKALRSGLVYKNTYSRCQSCYVEQNTPNFLQMSDVRIQQQIDH